MDLLQLTRGIGYTGAITQLLGIRRKANPSQKVFMEEECAFQYSKHGLVVEN